MFVSSESGSRVYLENTVMNELPNDVFATIRKTCIRVVIILILVWIAASFVSGFKALQKEHAVVQERPRYELSWVKPPGVEGYNPKQTEKRFEVYVIRNDDFVFEIVSAEEGRQNDRMFWDRVKNPKFGRYVQHRPNKSTGQWYLLPDTKSAYKRWVGKMKADGASEEESVTLILEVID